MSVQICKVVVHGFGGEIHIDEKFAAAYAEAGLDYNVIGVDWRDVQVSALKDPNVVMTDDPFES